jgi:lipopolysaccharide/colanic/teichoic acid biosynthesis glycosyltransferase
LRAKRTLDIVAALALLLLSLPVLAFGAVAVLLSMGPPILFVQRRPGKDAKPFDLLKLRTMTQATGPGGRALPDAVRLTRVGRLLRATSIDELPQLWNVLQGDLSLVGPRPLLMQYLPRYTARQARRHEVLPGITGWAQVNGRNALSWEEKFELDVWYVEHWSFVLDLRILVLTIGRVLSRAGISGSGQVTMNEFMGTASDLPTSGSDRAAPGGPSQ